MGLIIMIILFIILLIKSVILHNATSKAIERVYTARNYKDLRKYLPIEFNKYIKFIFTINKWTYSQYFKELEECLK